ncbi:MAG: SpoIIE family protein phosphatase [Phycisphaerae bacterium]|nr:SpoIIE family protein phosphatase [Phycisphaerae bacterium]NUQ44911.1 SpoIIE family protein phosphatase [Phycisphaerae bacterium]
MNQHDVPKRDDAKRVADFQRLLEVTRYLGATVELGALLARIAEAGTAVLDCERATVFILDRATNELYSRFATGVAESGMQEIRFPATLGIAGEVARTGQLVNVPEAYADPRFNPEVDRKSGFRTHNILTCPLRDHDNSIVGVLQLLNKRGRPFDARDEELAYYLGAQAGVAVQRQMLLEHFAQKQQMQRDLNIARQIQQGLLPSENPKVAGFDAAGWNQPADETGGDCFDFMTLPDGKLALAIADATGHGIGPALVIAECRALFRATILRTTDLARVVTDVNYLLHEDLPDDRFVTAFFGVLDPKACTVDMISGGHGPILWFEGATGQITEIEPQGLPLGVMDGIEYDPPERRTFAPGDMLALITDGFFEWARADGEQFGTDRIYELLRIHRERPAAEIIARIYEAVRAFAPGTKQGDDLTAVIVKRT